MPDPKAGESQESFISRCLPIVMGEGKTKEQALGACYGMFRYAKKGEVIKSMTLIKDLITKEEENIAVIQYSPEILEKAQSVGGFESPEPGDLPEAGKNMLAKVYAKCRKDGGDKEKCAKIAWSSVHHAGYKSENKLAIYKNLEKNLGRLVKIIKSERMETIREELPQPSRASVEIAIPKEEGSVGQEVIEKYYDNKAYAEEIRKLLMDAPIENIPLDQLIATQKEIRPSVLREKEQTGDTRPIYAIKFKDKYYIYDGHHRVAVAKLEGLQTIKAKILTVDSKANPVMKALAFKSLKDLKTFIKKTTEKDQIELTLDKNGNIKNMLDEALKKEEEIKNKMDLPQGIEHGGLEIG